MTTMNMKEPISVPTPETTTIPTGIKPLSDICWHLVYPGGALVDTGDCIPHFDTEREAAAEASQYAAESLGRPAPQQLSSPCWIAQAVCGYRFDEEGECALVHFESDADALKIALDSEMRIGACGDLHCSADCDECKQDCGATRPYVADGGADCG